MILLFCPSSKNTTRSRASHLTNTKEDSHSGYIDRCAYFLLLCFFNLRNDFVPDLYFKADFLLA